MLDDISCGGKRRAVPERLREEAAKEKRPEGGPKKLRGD